MFIKHFILKWGICQYHVPKINQIQIDYNSFDILCWTMTYGCGHREKKTINSLTTGGLILTQTQSPTLYWILLLCQIYTRKCNLAKDKTCLYLDKDSLTKMLSARIYPSQSAIKMHVCPFSHLISLCKNMFDQEKKIQMR